MFPFKELEKFKESAEGGGATPLGENGQRGAGGRGASKGERGKRQGE